MKKASQRSRASAPHHPPATASAWHPTARAVPAASALDSQLLALEHTSRQSLPMSSLAARALFVARFAALADVAGLIVSLCLPSTAPSPCWDARLVLLSCRPRMRDPHCRKPQYLTDLTGPDTGDPHAGRLRYLLFSSFSYAPSPWEPYRILSTALHVSSRAPAGC